MIKTILILADQTTAFETALASGIEFAKRFGAHLDVLHVRADPVGVVPLAAEGLPPSVTEEIRTMAEKTSKEHEHKARATYDRLCASSGVSASWRIATGRKTDIAAAAARLNDLVLVGRSTVDDPSWRNEIESMLFNGGRPLLLLPRDSQPFLGKRAAVAWNGSAQAARAVTGALPFLRLARGSDISAPVQSTSTPRPPASSPIFRGMRSTPRRGSSTRATSRLERCCWSSVASGTINSWSWGHMAAAAYVRSSSAV